MKPNENKNQTSFSIETASDIGRRNSLNEGKINDAV